ncbi:iron ABC transporter permease [Candidatus Pacearchaeota archaeon]|nr:iron ABC transporter permease [Candidatus Pacearchaeota archaeon]
MNKILTDYKKHIKKNIIFLLITSILLSLFILIGLTMGSMKMTLSEVLLGIARKGENEIFSQIIFHIRLPRVLSAVLAGAALAISGAAMQCILRNPLGSPFTLGISHSAAFGAAFAVIVLGAGSTHSSNTDAVIFNNPYIITISAFTFSMISSMFILFISKLKGAKPETMILTGIALGSLATAGYTSLQYFADDIQLSSIIFWTFGDLGRGNWKDFIILSLVIVPSTIYFIKNSFNYNVLDAGDETAKSLGINVKGLRLWGMLIASLSTALVVSFFGIIAFVGLVVPHIVRRIIGSNERFLIPASAIFGALFLLISDTIARTIISPIVLPVGILTSFLGAPLFLYLLIRGIKEG